MVDFGNFGLISLVKSPCFPYVWGQSRAIEHRMTGGVFGVRPAAIVKRRRSVQNILETSVFFTFAIPKVGSECEIS